MKIKSIHLWVITDGEESENPTLSISGLNASIPNPDELITFFLRLHRFFFHHFLHKSINGSLKMPWCEHFYVASYLNKKLFNLIGYNFNAAALKKITITTEICC
jgi:hypothetical protein